MVISIEPIAPGLPRRQFMEELQAFPVTARNYLRDGRWTPRPAGMLPGDRSTYPDLARSLQLIAKDGPDAFYRGAIAQAIASDMAANGGLITREDLARYQVLVEPALTGRYRDVDLAFSPGPTGGRPSHHVSQGTIGLDEIEVGGGDVR